MSCIVGGRTAPYVAQALQGVQSIPTSNCQILVQGLRKSPRTFPCRRRCTSSLEQPIGFASRIEHSGCLEDPPPYAYILNPKPDADVEPFNPEHYVESSTPTPQNIRRGTKSTSLTLDAELRISKLNPKPRCSSGLACLLLLPAIFAGIRSCLERVCESKPSEESPMPRAAPVLPHRKQRLLLNLRSATESGSSNLRFPIRLRRGLGFGFRCCRFLGLAILGLWLLDLDLGASCRDFVGLGCHP